MIKTKEDFIKQSCQGFSQTELNIVDNTWRTATAIAREESREEMIDRYRKELRAYKVWSDGCKSMYGSLEVLGWDEADFRKIMNWNEKLDGMVLVLGLTKSEVSGIDAEVGIQK